MIFFFFPLRFFMFISCLSVCVFNVSWGWMNGLGFDKGGMGWRSGLSYTYLFNAGDPESLLTDSTVVGWLPLWSFMGHCWIGRLYIPDMIWLGYGGTPLQECIHFGSRHCFTTDTNTSDRAPVICVMVLTGKVIQFHAASLIFGLSSRPSDVPTPESSTNQGAQSRSTHPCCCPLSGHCVGESPCHAPGGRTWEFQSTWTSKPASGGASGLRQIQAKGASGNRADGQI